MARIKNPTTGSEGVEPLTVKANIDDKKEDFSKNEREVRRSNQEGYPRRNYSGHRNSGFNNFRNDGRNKFSKEKNTAYFKEKALEIQNIINAKLDANPDLKQKLKFLASVSKMMEYGFHIGLPAAKWNSKMKPYIYNKKGKRYIIDLFQTLVGLNEAYDFLEQKSKNGKKFLFVSTRGDLMKRVIKEQAKRSGNYFIDQRWLGGTLTNFKTIRVSTEKLTKLVIERKFGKIDPITKEKIDLPKKEQISINKEIEKLNKFFGGIRTMTELPDAIIVTNPAEEKNAILEAKKMKIPVIAICNTNSNPDNITIPIPANNYSVKVVALIVTILADAIASGQNQPLQFVGLTDPDLSFDIKKNNV